MNTMDDRSTKCISQVFGLLKEVEHCEDCDGSSSTFVDDKDSEIVKRSVSDTKLFKSPVHHQPQVVRKCVCHLTKQKGWENSDCIVQVKENGILENKNTTLEDEALPGVNENVNGLCQQTTNDETKKDMLVQKKSENEERGGENGQVVNDGEEDVELRVNGGKASCHGNRTNTQIVSEMFSFLKTNSAAVDENSRHLDNELEDIVQITCSQSKGSNSDERCKQDKRRNQVLDIILPVGQCEQENGCATTDIDDCADSIVRNGCEQENEVVANDNARETTSETLNKNVSEDRECSGEGEVVIRRRQSSRKSEADDLSDDSSDEDTGIYAESHRNSTWIRVNENGDLSEEKSASLPTRRIETQVPVRASSASMSDDVFTEERGAPRPTHKRSDSSSTTLSETEFKRQYASRRKCLIQRNDSSQEYHRFSVKFYDQEKVVHIQREERDSDFGIHILDYQPAYITSIDPGSPAARAGIQEGQIVISVNGINVLEATHDEIVSHMQQDPRQIRLEVAYSDFQPVRDLQASVMAGYMYKLGNSQFMRSWKKRYFILRQDNCLYYYKTEQDPVPLGAVPLSGYTISRHIDNNKDYCFKTDKYGARSYFFMTESREEMTAWVGKLTEAAARSKKRKESWLDVSSHNVGLPALEIRRPESTGYLSKMGRQRRVWKKRYCVLKDACIYYYKSMSSHSAQGVAHLHGYEVDQTGVGGKRHSFILKPPEAEMRTFYFCADNETDKTRWVDAMTKSIQRWIKVDSNN